jgi:hypothetical protein
MANALPIGNDAIGSAAFAILGIGIGGLIPASSLASTPGRLPIRATQPTANSPSPAVQRAICPSNSFTSQVTPYKQPPAPALLPTPPAPNKPRRCII